MAIPPRDISPHISSNISSKISKWVLRATTLVKEKEKKTNSNGSQFYCEYPDPDFPRFSDGQHSEPVAVPKSTMSSSRPRQRKLSSITPPNLEKIVEHPRRTRKMSAPCPPHNFEFQFEDKNLKRNAHSGSNIPELECKESHRGNLLSDTKNFESPTFYNSESGALNSASVSDREINNNDNDCLLKEPRECKKLSSIGVNKQETRNHFVNSIGDTALNHKCLANNARGDDRKANITILQRAQQAGNTEEERKLICTDSNSPPSLSNHLVKSEDLAMPVLSQQITARLQKWVESATKRALARERKYSEDSISSNSSNNESVSPGTQENNVWGTRNEPAKPSEIRELESAIKELVTGIGSKGSLKRGSGTVAQNCTKSREESLSLASDCSDCGCRLSDSRSDDLSDYTAGKDEIDALSDDRTISKIAGLSSKVSSEQSASVTSKTGQGNDAIFLSSNKPIRINKSGTSTVIFENPGNKIMDGRSTESDEIKYSKTFTLKGTNKAEQQVNKPGMTTEPETKATIKEKINPNKNEFEGKKVSTIVEPSTLAVNNFRNKSRENEKEISSGTNSTNTSDEEKSGLERKLPKRILPPRPPRPNLEKRYTSPNSEGLKVKEIPKRESLPAIFDFKDTELAEFAQTCVRQANKKGKRLGSQKKATGSENNKHEGQNGNAGNKQNILNPSPELERIKPNQTSDTVKQTKSSHLLANPTKATSSTQGLIETQVLNEEELYHEFENVNQNPFSHAGLEKSPNVFEKLSKGKKAGSPKTPKLHKFPSLPMFYRPKSPKTTTIPDKSKERRRRFSHSSNKSKSSETDDSVTEQVDPEYFRSRSGTISDDSQTPELWKGRRRSDTMPINFKEPFHCQSPPDPFYHGLEANGTRAWSSTISADSLPIDISRSETSENQREPTPNADNKTRNDHKSRRRKVSAPCLPIPYVEELV